MWKSTWMAPMLCATLLFSLPVSAGEPETVPMIPAVSAYSFGEEQTFHSEEEANYSLLFSDHENYPYNKKWRIFSAIQEKTNVSLTVFPVSREEYESKLSTYIFSSEPPYIISKVYDEAPYIAEDALVPISDWVQYMPNYQAKVKAWGLEEELQTTLSTDGKYYLLPGMHESADSGYSFIIRKDLFEAAGLDVEELEKDWTYEEFAEALKTVKDATHAEYIFSDQYLGNSLLKVASVEYDATGGWSLGNGIGYDEENDSFYFAEDTKEFQDFLTVLHGMVEDRILDPASFTQTDAEAVQQFLDGKTCVISGNYQTLEDIRKAMSIEGAELYMVTPPGGDAGLLQTENTRLDAGLLITTYALQSLGEDGFIKMLRFIDWLWYSDEGQLLSMWGIEGETYTMDGETVVLNPDIYYNGINLDAKKFLNSDYGFGGGVFLGALSDWLVSTKTTSGENDFDERVRTTREERAITPKLLITTEQAEELDLIRAPLLECVDTWTRNFITGEAELDSQWEEYLAECESLRLNAYVELYNEIYHGAIKEVHANP